MDSSSVPLNCWKHFQSQLVCSTATLEIHTTGELAESFAQVQAMRRRPLDLVVIARVTAFLTELH